MGLRPFFHQKVVHYLAVISSHLQSRPERVSGELLCVPTDVLGALLDELHGEEWQSPERFALLELLSHDSRPEIAHRIVRILRVAPHRQPPERTIALLQRLAAHARGVTLLAVTRTLVQELRRAGEFQRRHLSFTWALSKVPAVRAVLARALARTGEVDCARYTLLYLGADPHPSVRAAVATAAGRRFREAPACYRTLLRQLQHDRSVGVRRTARRATWLAQQERAAP